MVLFTILMKVILEQRYTDRFKKNFCTLIKVSIGAGI